MKRGIFILVFGLTFLFGNLGAFNLYAAESIEPLSFEDSTASGTTSPAVEKSGEVPLRLCFFPNSVYWPKGLDVWGLNLGLPISFAGDEKVYGIDFALIASMTDKVDGLQSSIISKGYQGAGAEISFVNFAEEFTGFQGGVLNTMSDSDAVQLGLFNISNGSNGLQLGLINIMDNGFFPIFPFINFSM